MKDLTQDSITRNIVGMAAPIAAGMLFQTLYFLVDLYFVAAIGDAAVAGVGAAGTLMFIVMALTQVLGVGAVALIAQAVGRKDQADANLVFNQSVLFAFLCAAVTLIGGYALTNAYVGAITADPETLAARRDVSLLVPARASARLRASDDGLRDARHGYREARDGDPSAHGAAERRARAGAHRWLGHGLRDGRRGRRAREHAVDRARCRSARALLREAREVRVVPQRAVAPAAQGLAAACSTSVCPRAASSR